MVSIRPKAEGAHWCSRPAYEPDSAASKPRIVAETTSPSLTPQHASGHTTTQFLSEQYTFVLVEQPNSQLPEYDMGIVERSNGTRISQVVHQLFFVPSEQAANLQRSEPH